MSNICCNHPLIINLYLELADDLFKSGMLTNSKFFLAKALETLTSNNYSNYSKLAKITK